MKKKKRSYTRQNIFPSNTPRDNKSKPYLGNNPIFTIQNPLAGLEGNFLMLSLI